MTVGFLTRMLDVHTSVIIKDHETKKTIWRGDAGLANFNDTVKDWDFSNGNIIYI